jgi:hypothetical protein
VSMYNISRSWADMLNFYILLFGVVSPAWCDSAMDPIKDQRQCNLLVQGHHWWRELDSRLWPWDKATILPMEKSKHHQDRKRWDRQTAKSWACSSFPLTSGGLLTKNLSWQAKQSTPHTTVTLYVDCVKMCEYFAPNFGEKRNVCCITSFSTSEFLTKNNMTVVPHPPFYSLFPIEDKTERPTIWHNWGYRCRIAGGAKHPHRTRLPGFILEMAEALGTVHTRGRGLLLGRW